MRTKNQRRIRAERRERRRWMFGLILPRKGGRKPYPHTHVQSYEVILGGLGVRPPTRAPEEEEGLPVAPLAPYEGRDR
jgi:hypothetical protein